MVEKLNISKAHNLMSALSKQFRVFEEAEQILRNMIHYEQRVTELETRKGNLLNEIESISKNRDELIRAKKIAHEKYEKTLVELRENVAGKKVEIGKLYKKLEKDLGAKEKAWHEKIDYLEKEHARRIAQHIYEERELESKLAGLKDKIANLKKVVTKLP
jgi:uncharacterized coiled-coil protein SlyX